MMQRICEKCELSKVYTNPCVQVTIVHRLSASGMSDPHMDITGQRNAMTLHRYSKSTGEQQQRMAPDDTATSSDNQQAASSTDMDQPSASLEMPTDQVAKAAFASRSVYWGQYHKQLIFLSIVLLHSFVIGLTLLQASSEFCATLYLFSVTYWLCNHGKMVCRHLMHVNLYIFGFTHLQTILETIARWPAPLGIMPYVSYGTVAWALVYDSDLKLSPRIPQDVVGLGAWSLSRTSAQATVL